MEPSEILALYDREMRLDPPSGRAQVHQRPGLTFLSVPPPSPHAGWVLYTRLEEATIEPAIDDVINFFLPYGGSFEWKVYDHDTPNDLKQRLEARGFVSEENEGLLVLDLAAVPADFWQPPQAEVRRITSAEGVADVAAIQAEVWGEPFDDLEEWLGLELVETPDALNVYVAYVDDQPASSAWIRFYPERQFAELYGGSTIERYRGRGIYRGLVAARARDALQRGVRFLAVDTSPMSRPILQKLGFTLLTYTQPFVWEAHT